MKTNAAQSIFATSAAIAAAVGASDVPAVASNAQAPSDGRDFDELLSFLRARNTKQYAVVPPSGIYEEGYVSIGGIEQRIAVHGFDRNNPVLLFLHAGPGDVTNPWTFIPFNGWLKHFTLVQWDQRGAGKRSEKPVPASLRRLPSTVWFATESSSPNTCARP